MGLNEIIQIGSRLKKIRTSKKITQKDLADKVGIPRTTYANYEANKREPNIEILNKITDALDVDITELMIDYSTIDNKLKFNFKSKDSIYLDELKNYYEIQEMLQNNGAFVDIDNIEDTVAQTGLNNFKAILPENELLNNLKGLELLVAIDEFLDNYEENEYKIIIEKMLNSLATAYGKEFKITLVDKEI